MKKKNDKAISFETRSARIKAVSKRVQEAYPMVGNVSGEDALWRSLTLDSKRDLNQMTQKRMQDIAFFLFDSNPMAHRVIEIVPDFCVGDGFTYTAEEQEVYEVIDKFWNDPDNNLDSSMYENVMELALYGENCFPVWVNPIDGAVKLGYIDPSTIIKVKKRKGNPRIQEALIWKPPRAKKERDLQIVQTDRNPRSKTFGKLIGDCFFFTVNKPIGATRGRSDLLSLADWLDGYDQFLFARLERAFLLNTFVWDVECEGMNKEELTEFVKSIPNDPKPGSIRAHNEKVKFNAISPKLEGQDASNEARLFKNQILGGAGYPEHWFAEGSKTTRATAQEMGLPTLKKLRRRQKEIKFQYMNMINFVIDQAIIAGTLKKDVNRKFSLVPSPIVSKDNKGLTESIAGFVAGLVAAVEQRWLTNSEAKSILKVLLSQVGAESFAIEKSPEEEKKDDYKIVKPKIKIVKQEIDEKDKKEKPEEVETNEK